MSSNDIAISVRGLSKAYTIAHDQEKHNTIAETVLARLKNPLRRPKTETFWALKDVDFDIKKGDVVGIIGRNGAGKSTLLKILSRITEPTQGEIDVYGRIGSLLEVGTGFHPELTGRENVYLNGAILGMSRAEIRKQFDAIVDFAGIEKFLDTPVKRYSSGMYVRLAFAVAAHVSPEILVIDEVLAVGDTDFQKKCVGKMKDVAVGGRTVLFVSHNLGMVRALCKSGILLANGRMLGAGPIGNILDAYLVNETAQTWIWKRPPSAHTPDTAYFLSIGIVTPDGTCADRLSSESSFQVRMQIRVLRALGDLQVAVRFTNQEGIPVFTTASSDKDRRLHKVAIGCQNFNVEVPGNLLVPGRYTIIAAVTRPGQALFDAVFDALTVDIEDFGSLATIVGDGRLGVVAPLLTWSQTTSDGKILSSAVT